MSEEKAKSLTPKGAGSRKRAFILFAVCTFCVVLLIARLVKLMLFDYKEYRAKELAQVIYQDTITAERGNITDRNGVILATNTASYRIFISPHDISDEDQRKLICTTLSETLEVEYDTVYQQSLLTDYYDRTIKRNVDEETAEKLKTVVKDKELERVIYFEETFARVYPYSSLASHLIGFCGTDGGRYGIELYYDSDLTGTPGKIVGVHTVSGGNVPYRYSTYIDAEKGHTIVSTIDYRIQETIEKYLKECAERFECISRAECIVMNPKNFEVLGMSVYPSFDLNNPSVLPSYYDKRIEEAANEFGEDSEEYKKALSAMVLEMWNNKTISETYEPGSTAKIFTVCMTLEEKLSALTDTYYCPGYHVVSGVRISCNNKNGHGVVTLAEGLEQSCNPTMMMLAKMIEADRFGKYFKNLGLDSKTGIDLPGETGSIYIAPENMGPVDLAVYSFGQRFNVTAMQQICALASISNGGYLMTPHVVKEIRDEKGNVVESFEPSIKHQSFSTETCKTISEILAEGVASHTGGSNNARVTGYEVAAKTGTAEKGTDGRYVVCSCVAYAPYYNPEVIVLFIVDSPTKGSLYGNTVAAPYVSKILEEILPYMGVEANYSASEIKAMQKSVRNYKGYSVSSSVNSIENSGFKYVIYGTGTNVTSQFPASGSSMFSTDGVIVLYTSENTEAVYRTVPDLRGLTAAEAEKQLKKLNLNIYINGSAASNIILNQSSEPGSSVPEGTIITITLGEE